MKKPILPAEREEFAADKVGETGELTKNYIERGLDEDLASQVPQKLDTSKNTRGFLIDVILLAVLRGGDHGDRGSRVFRYGRAAG